MTTFKEAIGQTISLIKDLPNSWQQYQEGTMSRSEVYDHSSLIFDGLDIQLEHLENSARAVIEIDQRNIKKDPRKS